MFDSRRTPRPSPPLPVVLSILVLVALPSAARSQTSDPPPRSDTITNETNFLFCQGNPYALCYYSGPAAPDDPIEPLAPALPCILSDGGGEATCTCYAIRRDLRAQKVHLLDLAYPSLGARFKCPATLHFGINDSAVVPAQENQSYSLRQRSVENAIPVNIL